MELLKEITKSKKFKTFLSGYILYNWLTVISYSFLADLVHRDLKMENILVKSSDINEANEIKLNMKVRWQL